MESYKPTVFITGATGLVGYGVALKFKDKGFRVKALVRNASKAKKLSNRGIELVQGDITALHGAVAKAMEECTSVIHTAALHNMLIKDISLYYKINLEGTKNLLQLTEQLRIPQFLFTSSIKSIGKNFDGEYSDESIPYNVKEYDGHYGQSKYEAEKYLMEYNGPVSVKFVNPACVIGVPDEKPTPTGTMIRDFIIGKIPFYLDTVINLVNLEDVADAHYLIYKSGKSKEKYLVSSEAMSMKEFFSLLSRLTGKPMPKIRMPFNVLLPMTYGLLGAHKLFGFPLLLRPDSVKMASLKIKYDGSKIVRELGLKYTSVEEGIKKEVGYFTSICRKFNE